MCGRAVNLNEMLLLVARKDNLVTPYCYVAHFGDYIVLYLYNHEYIHVERLSMTLS